MARPMIFDRPMTAAERQRRSRAAKMNMHLVSAADAALHLVPVRKFVRFLRSSERYYYYLSNFQKRAEIKWPDAILNGAYGKVGMEFLADVCQYDDASAQRAAA